jgi:hypothetical protein
MIRTKKDILSNSVVSSSSSSSETKAAAPAFLEKLFGILDEKSPYNHLIAWQPDGESFIIKKVHEFSEIVLPKYFKHSNIQSYIRQLNMYGFSKTRHDSTHREFTHKLFRRGRRDLLSLIKRKSQQITPPVSTHSSDTLTLSLGPKMNPDLLENIATTSPEERVTQLEHKLLLLASLYESLASKHNALCDRLQATDAEEDESNEDNDLENSSDSMNVPPLSVEMDTHDGCLLQRMSSIRSYCDPDDAPSATLTTLAMEHLGGEAISRLNTDNSLQSYAKRPAGAAGVDGSRLHVCKRSRDYRHLKAPTDVASLPHALSQRATSVDVTGIDAIAEAADLLDSGPDEMAAAAAGSYLLLQAGGTLKKAYSYG